MTCCSGATLPPCAGTCRNISTGSSCASGEREDTSSICSSAYQQCCTTAIPRSITGPTYANYTLLEKIPGSSQTIGKLNTYLEDIYRFAFWAVGIAVVFMLTIGGFYYLTSAGNTSQLQTAKTIIWDALLGLILALVAWLFLYILNPDLVNLTLPTSITIAPPKAVPAGTPGSGTAPRNFTAAQCSAASGGFASDADSCVPGQFSIGNFVDATNTISGVCCAAKTPTDGTPLQGLARTILLGTAGITVSTSGSCSGADAINVSPRRTLMETASGDTATTCHNGCNTTTSRCAGKSSLYQPMLQTLITIGGNYPFEITSFTGGSHSPGSAHYTGRSVDIVPAAPKSDWPKIQNLFRNPGGARAICDIWDSVTRKNISINCADPRADHIHAQW